MVIMQRIGQSAVELSKSVMIGYESHSETERVLVIDDGLINQRLLKIQSSLLGNQEDKECLQQLNSFSVYFLLLKI